MTFRFAVLSTLLSCGVLCYIRQYSHASSGNEHRIESFEQFSGSELPKDIILDVIARKGRSKTYYQLVPLDGGTVDIANFTVGGFASLYNEMATNRYFGCTKSQMTRTYSSRCRPKGRSGNDIGWDCYSLLWWKCGTQQFLRDPDTIKVQERAWLRNIKNTIRSAISHGWSTPRQLAIAAGISNSLGTNGFQQLATDQDWNAESALNCYDSGSAHRNRRREAIDVYFSK